MAEDEDTMVDETTIHLNGAPDEDIGNPRPTAKAMQAFQIELARETVREMQKYMRNGKSGIQLMLGRSPLLRYGAKSLPLRVTPTTFRTEIYKEEDERELHFQAIVTHTITTVKTDNILESVEPGLMQLQQRLATLAKEKEENRATFIDGVRDPKKMPPKKAPAVLRKSAMQQAVRRSMPASPAITASINAAAAMNSLQIPNAPSTAVSDAHRTAVLHFLALKPAKQEVIVQKTGVPTVDTLNILKKFGIQYGDEYFWRLSDRAYKFLDVWKFPYPSQEDRQFVIDSAIKAFDRQRISTSDKLWDSLLPEEERGKGKIISKLGIHKSFITPKEQVPQHRPLAKDNSEIQDLPNHRSLLANIGGEPMARERSLESIAMKKTESEARIKNFINKKSAKTSTPKMPPKVVAKKDGEVSKKAGAKKSAATGTPSQKPKQDQQDKLAGFATEEEASGLEETFTVTSGLINEQSIAPTATAPRKIEESKSTGQPRKTEKEFKSAERIDDSDDGLSDIGINGKGGETNRNAKRITNENVNTKIIAPSSTSGNTPSILEKPQKPDDVGKLQRPTPSQRNHLREAPLTPRPMNTTKKASIAKNAGSPSTQKLKPSKEMKQGMSNMANGNTLNTITPKVTNPTTTKKKLTSTNVGLGISLGGADAQKGERTIAVNKGATKRQTLARQNEDVTRENNIASKATAAPTTAQRPIPANQTQAAKRDPAPTDSSANSWASSLSAKSTPMHRQSSSQSSVSNPTSEMPPGNRKRAASPNPIRRAPPAKKSKKNERPESSIGEYSTPSTGKPGKVAQAEKPSPHGSSSSLSEAKSISPPSIQHHSDEVSSGLQKISDEDIVKTPHVSDSSPQQIFHTASVVGKYNETSKPAKVDPETSRPKIELENMKIQIRKMYADYIKRRMELDKADAADQETIQEELTAAWTTIEELSNEIKERSITLGPYEWHFGLPRGVQYEPEVLQYCHSKLVSVRQEYNTFSHELNRLPEAEHTEERRQKRKDLYREYKELMQIVYPTDTWLPSQSIDT